MIPPKLLFRKCGERKERVSTRGAQDGVELLLDTVRELLTGSKGAMYQYAIKQWLLGRDPWSMTPFHSLGQVTLGQIANVSDLSKALAKVGAEISGYPEVRRDFFNGLQLIPGLTYELYAVRISDLGLVGRPPMSEVFAAGEARGLGKCVPELVFLAALKRLASGQNLRFMMDPVYLNNGFQEILSLETGDNGRLWRCINGSSGALCFGWETAVFAKEILL